MDVANKLRRFGMLKGYVISGAMLLFFANYAFAYTPKFDKEKALKCLTPLQYDVTQKKDTELPFTNDYFEHK